jgi:ATP-dependent Clp protease ATP-binding subunit ClpA
MFDIAVQSRIHIAVKYEELDKDQTRKIFMQFVDQYKEAKQVKDYKMIQKFASSSDLYKKGFDGRQLRNLVASAIGYALSHERQLKMEDIHVIMNEMEAFKIDLDYQMKRYQGKFAMGLMKRIQY